MRLRIKFGQTHAVDNITERDSGLQVVSLACGASIPIAPEGKSRFTILPDGADDIGCYECKRKRSWLTDEATPPIPEG